MKGTIELLDDRLKRETKGKLKSHSLKICYWHL